MHKPVEKDARTKKAGMTPAFRNDNRKRSLACQVVIIAADDIAVFRTDDH